MEKLKTLGGLPPTLVRAMMNEHRGVFKSEGHSTACKACGKMMYHNMSGSDEDLCWVDVKRKGSISSERVWLCRPCLKKIQDEKKSMPA